MAMVLLALLFLLLGVSESTKVYNSAPPTWMTSPLFRAGNAAVIAILTGNSSLPTYTFTFSSALSNTPSLAYGIKNYRGNDYLIQQFFEIRNMYLDQLSFTVQIQIYGVTNIHLLTVAYIAVDPTFPYHMNSFDNTPLNYSSGNLVNITTYSPTLNYFTEYVNYTDQAQYYPYVGFAPPLSSYRIVLFITNLWIRATSSDPITLTVDAAIVNSSFYYMNVTLMKNVIITNIHFSQIIYNADDILTSNAYYVVYKEWIADALAGGFIEIPIQFVDNFIMAVTQFSSIKGQCGFEYQWEYTTNTTVPFGINLLPSWTINGWCGFSTVKSTLFYIETWNCPTPYYYFNVSSNLCQDLCAGYYYENSTSFKCQPCLDTLCYTCNSTTSLCTSCDTTLHRAVVNGSCVCDIGYYLLNQTCVSCSTPNVACLNCIYDDAANGTLNFSINYFSCLLCNQSLQYFLNTTINLCVPCSIPSCTTCANLTQCLICNASLNRVAVNYTCVCNNGYFEQNGVCVTCSSVNPQCLNCTYDDKTNGTLPFSLSYFTCTQCNQAAQYFIDVNTNLCAQCTLSNCINCFSLTQCLVCNPASATMLNAMNLCSTCVVVGCLTCSTSPTACGTCNVVAGYGLIGTLCYMCSDTCSCGGYTLPLVNNKCSTICGDGLILTPNEQCDDGNSNDYDGCSSKCKIEPYFSCYLQPSKCYVNTNIELRLNRTEMSTTSCNTITFTFYLFPSLPMFQNANNNWSDFVSTNDSRMSLKDSSYSISNSSGVMFSLTYHYNDTLQNTPVNWIANAAAILPNSTLLSQVSLTYNAFQIVPNNNVNAVLCDKFVCTGRDNTRNFIIAGQAISYFALFISLFSAKIVGLELFGVLQLGFFVLSDYNNVNQILTGMMGRKEVNGLNLGDNSFTNPYISQRVLSNGFNSEDFLQNINLMFLLTIITFLVGFVMYFITYLINKDSSSSSLQHHIEINTEPEIDINSNIQKRGPNKRNQLQLQKSHLSQNKNDKKESKSQFWHRISKHILKQAVLTFVMFNIFNISFSIGLQTKYLLVASPFSIICMLISIFLVIAVIIGQLCTDKREYGEYFDKFKKNKLEEKYIVVSLIYRFTLGLLLALLNDWTESGMVFITVNALFCTYLLYYEPFNDNIQNIRSICIHVTHSIILFVNLYYRIETADNPIDSSYIYLPAYVQIIVVFLCIIGSTAMLLYEFVKNIKNWLQKRNNKVDTISALSEDMMRDGDKNSVKAKKDVIFLHREDTLEN